jgi:hypothetical protein
MSPGTVISIVAALIVTISIGPNRRSRLLRRRCRAAVRPSSQRRCCRRSAGLVLARCRIHRTAPAYRRPRSDLRADPITSCSLWVVSLLLPPAERSCWSAELRSVLWESQGDRQVQRQQARGFLWALPATIWTSWMVVVLGEIRPRREFR